MLFRSGRDLAHLVKGDPRNTFVWFKIDRAFPDRFRTKNAQGKWVRSDDPSAPRGTTVPDPATHPSDGTARRLTTLEIDEGRFAAARAILGTMTLRETVDRAFAEVIARSARSKSLTRLQQMAGLDLDNDKVMEKAWR